MLTCKNAAKYFLALADDEDAGELISNMKLQKLLYYAQGFYLAKYGKPLFDAKIEAWSLGPVVPEVYHEYKSYGSDAIKLSEKLDFSVYDEDAREMLDEVYAVYGQFSAWKLSQMTHDELPWKKYHTKDDRTIPAKVLKEYFVTQLG